MTINLIDSPSVLEVICGVSTGIWWLDTALDQKAHKESVIDRYAHLEKLLFKLKRLMGDSILDDNYLQYEIKRANIVMRKAAKYLLDLLDSGEDVFSMRTVEDEIRN